MLCFAQLPVRWHNYFMRCFVRISVAVIDKRIVTVEKMELKEIILIISILSVFFIVGRARPSNEVMEEYNNDTYNILQLNYINYRQSVNLT